MISTLRYLRWNRSIKYSFTVSVSTAKTTSPLPNEDGTVVEAVRIKPSIGVSMTNKQSTDGTFQDSLKVGDNFISSEAALRKKLINRLSLDQLDTYQMQDLDEARIEYSANVIMQLIAEYCGERERNE